MLGMLLVRRRLIMHVVPWIGTIERARRSITSSRLSKAPEPRRESDLDRELTRGKNEWTPKQCLGSSLAGLSVMALEVPLAILYAAHRRAIHKGRRRLAGSARIVG